MSMRWYPRRLTQKVENATEEGMRDAAIFLEGQVKRSLGAHPKPQIVTGDLRRSITYEKVEELRYKVGSTLTARGGQPYSYAYYLEFGFRDRGGTKHRYPYLRPGLQANKKELARLMAKKV